MEINSIKCNWFSETLDYNFELKPLFDGKLGTTFINWNFITSGSIHLGDT